VHASAAPFGADAVALTELKRAERHNKYESAMRTMLGLDATPTVA